MNVLKIVTLRCQVIDKKTKESKLLYLDKMKEILVVVLEDLEIFKLVAVLLVAAAN